MDFCFRGEEGVGSSVASRGLGVVYERKGMGNFHTNSEIRSLYDAGK